MGRAIIIDNELPAIESLREMLLNNFPVIDIVATAENVPDGINAIKQKQPDLVFLDVEMPPDTGFDLLKQVGKINFEIIFTTSYDKYAIAAFKACAIDYLLKPFSPDDLRESLRKFDQKRFGNGVLQHVETLIQNLQHKNMPDNKIALPVQTGFVFIEVQDIIRCVSDNTYTTFYLKDKSKIVVSRSIKECEEILTPYNFFRVHNSHLINMNYIKEYVKGDGGIVKMSDNSEVDVSRKKKDGFLQLLKKV